MAEVTLLQHMSVLGVSFANTSDFSMLSTSTSQNFRPELHGQYKLLFSILSMAASKKKGQFSMHARARAESVPRSFLRT